METLKAKCKRLGVDYYRALKRRQAGLPEDKIFEKGYIRNTRAINEIKVYGVIYPNLIEAVRSLQPIASRKTISRLINNGSSPEEAFEYIPNPGYANGIIYCVTHKGTNKKYVGLTMQTLERRWKYHIEQATAGHIKSKNSLHYAIRKYPLSEFKTQQLDSGVTKKDLENKERFWIKELNTLAPNGYNISTGGVSGGSNKKPVEIDGIVFESVKKATAYLSKTRDISLSAAKKRIGVNRIDIKKRAKPGESLVHTKTYKAWSRIKNEVMNKNSKEYIPGIGIHEPWLNFHNFLKDVGHQEDRNMAFTRLKKDIGFYPDNCAWLTKSEASKINADHMKQKGTLIGRKAAKYTPNK